jgi:hypothetical protein
MIIDELENELRGAFAKTAQSIVVPSQARQRLLQRNYRPRTGNRRLAAGVAAAAVAAGIAIPLAGGGGSQPATAGPVMRLASYTLGLPVGYKLTAATSTPCHAWVLAVLPMSVVLPPHGAALQNPPYGGQMKAAASASGGCIVALLVPPYHPTTAVPDPEAPAAARPVQVGRYHGAIISRMLVTDLRNPRQAARHGIKPGWNNVAHLWVRLPDGGGKMRDLIVGAEQLSDAALIKIVANGLST